MNWRNSIGNRSNPLAERATAVQRRRRRLGAENDVLGPYCSGYNGSRTAHASFHSTLTRRCPQESNAPGWKPESADHAADSARSEEDSFPPTRSAANWNLDPSDLSWLGLSNCQDSQRTTVSQRTTHLLDCVPNARCVLTLHSRLRRETMSIQCWHGRLFWALTRGRRIRRDFPRSSLSGSIACVTKFSGNCFTRPHGGSNAWPKLCRRSMRTPSTALGNDSSK